MPHDAEKAIAAAIAYLRRVIGCSHFPSDLYADLYQAAALRIYEEGAADAESMFRAAKRGASAEYQKEYRHTAGVAVLMHLRRNGWREGGIALIRPQLEKLFLDCRRKKGGRGEKAAMRDATICDLLSRGYSDEGIALELGISYTSVRQYRKIIKKTLRGAIASKAQSCYDHVKSENLSTQSHE